MNAVPETNVEQTALWNGAGARGWVEAQDLLDRMLKPVEDVLVDAVRPVPARRVLDVGCGTGGVTVAVATALGAGSRCVGVDVSEPMIAAARARTEREGAPASFIRADAQSHTFEPGGFDLIVSRFGVMFFDDVARAFDNLRRATRDGGELRFIVWRGMAENPFMTTAERAAAPLLPNLPDRDPDAPGQFALADADRVRRALAESAWTGIDIQPVDVACSLPEQELARYVTLFGPVGRALQEADDRLRDQVVDAVLPAFAPFVRGTRVRFTAACWVVTARAASDQV
ncbi:class I SAM-dependent methyltransferase [Amycolatopsis cihanbeyliensis]|uniref:Methyltransferase family protein n=1 Tax=Amycolatopsis cihanbeyliensis TaxID=1128664 RepID=A0A542CUK9_AMYCI|nr:class I SAM-dependent methyltransferase [Amycolatopsis cihanbeyliensis]TQI94491.1 methyltransferase family protein [Amycolatopsis cihanbeyliensis]